jgi:hypothetical protein
MYPRQGGAPGSERGRRREAPLFCQKRGGGGGEKVVGSFLANGISRPRGSHLVALALAALLVFVPAVVAARVPALVAAHRNTPYAMHSRDLSGARKVKVAGSACFANAVWKRRRTRQKTHSLQKKVRDHRLWQSGRHFILLIGCCNELRELRELL